MLKKLLVVGAEKEQTENIYGLSVECGDKTYIFDCDSEGNITESDRDSLTLYNNFRKQKYRIELVLQESKTIIEHPAGFCTCGCEFEVVTKNPLDTFVTCPGCGATFRIDGGREMLEDEFIEGGFNT